jgi:glycosyltransferase involved in cell wall biosynthesis
MTAMLRGHDIVCFANDWGSDPTSKTHIMRRLARHNRVLWVNSIGNRNPRVSGRDLRRVAGKLRDFCRGCRAVAPNLWTFTPLLLPLHGSRLARRVNRHLLPAMVRLACRRLGMSRPIVWSFVPSSAVAAGRLDERLLVYQCVDEFSRFAGVDSTAIAALEASLARRADLVVVSSERLYEAKRGYNPRTFVVNHGVDVEHFGAALEATAPPAEVAGLRRPVVGFFGLVAEWVDLELCAFVARARPEWTLLLIGPSVVDLTALARLPNVRVLGRRRYADLPQYCKAIDAAILPFRLDELTLAANPLKLREYLAAGLPVVATAIPEAVRLAPWVEIGRDREEFLARLDGVLAARDEAARHARAAAMGGESWDRKVEELSAIVGRFLGREAEAGAGARPAAAARRPQGAQGAQAQGAQGAQGATP